MDHEHIRQRKPEIQKKDIDGIRPVLILGQIPEGFVAR